MRWRRFWRGYICVLACGACSSHAPKSALYVWCNETLAGADCASGFCAVLSPNGGTFCAQACDGAGACPSGGRCGIGADGTKACFATCDRDSSGEFVCVHGAVVSCWAEDATACAVCGCPAGLRCEAGIGCVALSSVGGQCSVDTDCDTGNCSTEQPICRVAGGAACTPDNCDRCLSDGAGYSYCARTCTSDTPCNGGRCLGDVALAAQRSFDGGEAVCVPSCTGCPGTCKSISGTSVTYCDCSTCTLTPVPGDYGYPCGRDVGCVPGTSCIRNGTSECTKPCTTTADCGAGFACVVVPCDQLDGGASTCPVCMGVCGTGPCPVGTCHTVSTVEGAAVAVCDSRLPDGADCGNARDCKSGQCVGNSYCLYTSGGPRGVICSVDTHCASNHCSDGFCTGSVPIGGVCNSVDDCAIGSCCLSGSNAGTCQTSCS